jgi:Fic family protein
MNTFSNQLKSIRIKSNLKIIDLAMQAKIDPSLISKYESGTRNPSEKHLKAIVNALGSEGLSLRAFWLSEKVAKVVMYEIEPFEILMLAEPRVEYLRSSNVLDTPEPIDSIQMELKTLTEMKVSWVEKKPLNTTQLTKMAQYFHTNYTFESNRIEGNTLSLQETHLIVNEGITISGKTMREHLEAVNHSEAVDFIIQLVQNREDLTKRTLLELHRLILKSIDNDNAGRYRSVPVRISGSMHEPPQPYMVDKMMEDYFYNYARQKNSLHPVILAAEMHERLVSIHPFIDGNGRTSRLVMNLILLRNGYTITNLKGDLNSRLAYYKALEMVQVDNEPNHFYQLIVDRVKASLSEHLEMI